MQPKNKCPLCNNIKKPFYPLCYDCTSEGLEAPSQKEIDVKETKANANHKFTKVEKNSKFPTHSDFYRDLHLWQSELVNYLLLVTGLPDEEKYTYRINIEEHYWDLIVWIGNCPYLNTTEDNPLTILVEYKSSVKEMGKQVDAFMRQIKARYNKGDMEGPIVICSFDRRFKPYYEAFEMAGIKLIVFPKDSLDDIEKRKKNPDHPFNFKNDEFVEKAQEEREKEHIAREKAKIENEILDDIARKQEEKAEQDRLNAEFKRNIYDLE